MIPGIAIVLSATLSLPPLRPVQTVDLSKHGAAASDVVWLDDRQLLVGLLEGGVIRVTPGDGVSTPWLKQESLPVPVPEPELLASHGDTVVVMGGGRRSYLFLTRDGRYVGSRTGGGLNPRGVAISGGRAFYIGWVTKQGTDEDQQRGVLWSQVPGKPLNPRPLHRIVRGEDALRRWRLTMHPYGGSVVALPDGSVALITSAEPGVYRYDSSGRLIEVLGNGVDSLVVDSPRLIKAYATEIVGRYRDVLDRQPTIDDLIVTPTGLAILVRTVKGDRIQWQLWRPGRTDIISVQPLEPGAHAPIGHMKCDARGLRLACVTNLPTAEQAAQPGPAGSNPTLYIYDFGR